MHTYSTVNSSEFNRSQHLRIAALKYTFPWLSTTHNASYVILQENLSLSTGSYKSKHYELHSTEIYNEQAYFNTVTA